MEIYKQMPNCLKQIVMEYTQDKDKFDEVMKDFDDRVNDLIASADWDYASYDWEEQDNINPKYISKFHEMDCYTDKFVEKENHKYYNRNELIRDLKQERKEYLFYRRCSKKLKRKSIYTFSNWYLGKYNPDYSDWESESE